MHTFYLQQFTYNKTTDQYEIDQADLMCRGELVGDEDIYDFNMVFPDRVELVEARTREPLDGGGMQTTFYVDHKRVIIFNRNGV